MPASDALTSTAHALAVAHWGVEPCAGQVTVTWAHMGAGINARSQWMSYDIHNPATYTQCSITYNLDVDWDWPKLCTVIEHELGHLAGHDHVDDPHDVMSPYYVYPTPECAAGWRPGGRAGPGHDGRGARGVADPEQGHDRKQGDDQEEGQAQGRQAQGGLDPQHPRQGRTARSARAKKASAKKASAKAGTRGAVRAAAAESSTLPLLVSCPFGA